MQTISAAVAATVTGPIPLPGGWLPLGAKSHPVSRKVSVARRQRRWAHGFRWARRSSCVTSL